MAIRKIVARSIGVDVIVAEDLADNSITAAEITNGAVTADKLASNSVTTAKITDANVTTGKLATDLVVTHALGSASTPSITFTGDTNTGIFSPAADTIAFTEGGAESMRIDSSGNVGINTTSAGVKLGVVDTSAGAATFPTIIGNRGTTVGTQVNFGLQTYDAGSAGITNVIGSVTTSASSGAGSADMVFQTTASGTRAERMRITSGGNVGIGVTPAASTVTTLQLGTSTFSEGGGATSLASNMVRDTTWKAINTGTSGLYQIGGDAHYWYTAASVSGGTNVALTERMRIDSSGRVLMGTTVALESASVLNIYGNAKFSIVTERETTATVSAIGFRNPNGFVGYVQTSGSSTLFTTSSDYRLKNTIAPITGALAKVALLKPVTYKWNVDGADGQGFIAHELQAVVPECVSGEKDAVNEDGSINPQGIDVSFLVATLTAAIQEQQAMIDALKARLDAAGL
jgi:hypothetical protein